MTRITPKSLIAALAVAATASLAACESAPRSVPATTVQPTPEGAIQWNTPRQATNGAASDTNAGNTSASGKPQPGDTIHFQDENPPAASGPPTTLPDTSATGPAVTPVPGASGPSTAPSASAAPPATPVPSNQAPSRQAPAQPGPPIAWRGGLDGNVLQIEVIDRYGHYRVDRVSLVSPQGQEYVAPELTYLAPRYGSSGGGVSNVGIGVGGWGGSSSGTSLGLGLGFPLGGSSPPRDVDANAPRTVARIPLPDPQGYRLNPMGWTVRVRLLDPSGAASIAQFPAPLPPRP
jgi:hypothetical protein